MILRVVIQTTYCSLSIASPRSVGRCTDRNRTGPPGRPNQPRPPSTGKGAEHEEGVLLAALAGSVVVALTGAALVASVGPPGASASSHREAPLIADDPAADNTDVYAFVSPDRRTR